MTEKEKDWNIAVVLFVIVGGMALMIWGCNAALDAVFPARKNLQHAEPAPYDFERDPDDAYRGS